MTSNEIQTSKQSFPIVSTIGCPKTIWNLLMILKFLFSKKPDPRVNKLFSTLKSVLTKDEWCKIPAIVMKDWLEIFDKLFNDCLHDNPIIVHSIFTHHDRAFSIRSERSHEAALHWPPKLVWKVEEGCLNGKHESDPLIIGRIGGIILKPKFSTRFFFEKLKDLQQKEYQVSQKNAS